MHEQEYKNSEQGGDNSGHTSETKNSQMPGNASELGKFIWDLVKVFIISMAIILPVRYFIAQPFIVSGSSMEPNFYNGEYLIVNEIGYTLGQPARGDVIVFKFPKDTSQYFIKRIIGLPGERLKLADNKIIIYNKEHPTGWVLEEKYLPATDLTFASGEFNNITMGSDEFFVLGDNRMASSDSRFWGPVPRQDIIGKVFVRAFPFQSFKKFDVVQYPK